MKHTPSLCLLLAVFVTSPLASAQAVPNTVQTVLSGTLQVTLPPGWESLGEADDDTVMLVRLSPYSGYVLLAAGNATSGEAGLDMAPPAGASSSPYRFLGEAATAFEWSGTTPEFELDRSLAPGRYRMIVIPSPAFGGRELALRIAGHDRFHESEALRQLLDSLAPTNAPANISHPTTTTTASSVADQRIPELLALAAQGKLTVRALRGFGQLDVRYDATALTLRKRGLDLYTADARQIETWLSASGGPLKDLPDTTLTALQELARKLREYDPPAR